MKGIMKVGRCSGGDKLSVPTCRHSLDSRIHIRSWADVVHPLIPQKWRWDAGSRLAS